MNVIGITMGDPSGIGPEIALKAISELHKHYNLVLIGSKNILQSSCEEFKIPYIPEIIESSDELRKEIPYGKSTKEAGKSAYKAILKGIELLKLGKISAIVTAPISKKSLQLAGIRAPGHTEIFARQFGVKDYAMMLVKDDLRVTLVTTHLPIREVPKSITREQVFIKIILTAEFLNKKLKVQTPRIGVCSLNPHAGEIGGDEENEAIIPAIKDARNKGVSIEGPFAGDTIWTRKFDAYIAMYHDQGLIPLKINGVSHVVNVTLGLPFVRTSPGHGTAFDIAGKGIADPTSMINAIEFAYKILGK